MQSKTMMPTMGTRPIPLQSTTLPMATTTPSQLDITSIFELMLPLMVVVMMLKVMTGAFGEKPKSAPVRAS